jgi:hypothetical protein
MRLNELKDFLAARCDSGQIGRILNYDQSGRTFAVFSLAGRWESNR